MKFALLLGTLGAVAAQSPCMTTYTDATSCAANSSCYWVFGCGPMNATAGTCGGSMGMTTCSGPSTCAAGSVYLDAMMCNKCADTCATLKDNSTCSANANCKSSGNFCYEKTTVAPTPVPPCSGASQSSCTSEAGCFWVGFTISNICGGPLSGMSAVYNTMYSTNGRCLQCNSTTMNTGDAIRGAASRLNGMSCNWGKSGNFVANLTVSLNGFNAGSGANCPAVAAVPSAGMSAQMTADLASITAAMAVQGLVDTSAPVSCWAAAKPNDSSMLSPSLAVLGLVAFLTRL